MITVLFQVNRVIQVIKLRVWNLLTAVQIDKRVRMSMPYADWASKQNKMQREDAHNHTLSRVGNEGKRSPLPHGYLQKQNEKRTLLIMIKSIHIC